MAKMIDESINLKATVAVLKKRFSMILVLGFLGLVASGGITYYLLTPQYHSSTQLLVKHTVGASEFGQAYDVQTNIQLINTYKDVIKGPVILEEVRNNLKTPLSIEELAGKITVESSDQSQVFSIIVEDANPYLAAEIANETANIFKSEIGTLMDVRNVAIFSTAKPNLAPISPNLGINLILGLVMGLGGGVLLSLILEKYDRTIQDEQFIREVLEWVPLGNISESKNAETKMMKENTIDVPLDTIPVKNKNRI
ncbi:Tyrosine-protein kinase transmembrane modulator EpsC [Carnobacterium antarcticum]|nr:Tyrosine-protein kinase transmembrane modulator EpsC [Carnobacterium sp. CP1]